MTTAVALVVVFLERWAIVWIRNRFMEPPIRPAMCQILPVAWGMCSARVPQRRRLAEQTASHGESPGEVIRRNNRRAEQRVRPRT